MIGSIKKIDVHFSDYNGCQGTTLDIDKTLTFVSYDKEAK
jgi:hypothetical protein